MSTSQSLSIRKLESLRQHRRQIMHTSAVRQQNVAVQARDCWAVAFGNMYNAEERVLLAGYDNGDVKMFDLRTNKCDTTPMTLLDCL